MACLRTAIALALLSLASTPGLADHLIDAPVSLIGPPAREPCGWRRTLGPVRYLNVTLYNGANANITGGFTVRNSTFVVPPQPYAFVALTEPDSALCIAARSNPYTYADDTLPDPLIAGLTYILPHGGSAEPPLYPGPPETGLLGLVLVDQFGTTVPAGPTTYTASLTAGTVTASAMLDLSAYFQPLVARLTWAHGEPQTWEAVTWAPPVGFALQVTDPGGLNALHVHGSVTVPSGGVVSATGTPQRLPALLMSWSSCTGTWADGPLPAGTALAQDPPGMAPGLYLVEAP